MTFAAKGFIDIGYTSAKWQLLAGYLKDRISRSLRDLAVDSCLLSCFLGLLLCHFFKVQNCEKNGNKSNTRRFPSCLKPLFQSEAKCEAIDTISCK